MLARSAEWLIRCARILGADGNIKGFWYRNDTIGRTSLDIQRIILFGREEGTVAPMPQRRWIIVTDAVVAREGGRANSAHVGPSGISHWRGKLGGG